MPSPFEELPRLAAQHAARAHVPYSGESEGAVVLLADGHWVPGVRVESATFSLTLPALVAAIAGAYALGRADLVAVGLSRPISAADAAYLEGLEGPPWRTRQARVWSRTAPLPAPTTALSPLLPSRLASPGDGVQRAREIAGRAYTPASRFPVGTVVETSEGDLVPGVNVEHPDWTRIVCAERTALALARSYDLGSVRRVYLSCPLDPGGTPCGACRQWLAEHASGAEVWMDRGAEPPECTSPSALLPGSFQGDALPPPPEALR